MLYRKWPYRVAKNSLAIMIFVLVIFIVRDIQYTAEPYVCTHMSRDLEDVLEYIGFDVKIVVGQAENESQSGHAWIRIGDVDIDSVWLIPMFWKLDNFKRDRVVYEDFADYAQNSNWAVADW